MELLASYGKRSGGVPVVGVVSEPVIRHGAALINLRTGATVGSLRTIDHTWSAGGRVLRSKQGVHHIVQPNGSMVPLAIGNPSSPRFVGETLVTQDHSAKGEPFAVFDGSTGALRGALTHSKAEPFLAVDPDGKRLWLSDVTELVCWDLERLEVVTRVAVPKCYRIAFTAKGELITTSLERGLVVVTREGREVARRALPHRSFAKAGEVLVVASSEAPELLLLDDRLEPKGSVPLPPKVDLVELQSLPWGKPEVLAVDWNNQAHHYGDASLRPSGETVAPKMQTTVKKKPPAKKKAK